MYRFFFIFLVTVGIDVACTGHVGSESNRQPRSAPIPEARASDAGTVPEASVPSENDGGPADSGVDGATSPPGEGPPSGVDQYPDELFVDCEMALAGTPCSNRGEQCWFSDAGCAIAGHCLCDQDVWSCTDQQMCGDCPPPKGGGWDHQGCK